MKRTAKQYEEAFGRFGDVAEVAQGMKAIIRDSENWKKISNEEREALDAVVLQIAHICCAKGKLKPFWGEITTYSQMIDEMFL